MSTKNLQLIPRQGCHTSGTSRLCGQDCMRLTYAQAVQLFIGSLYKREFFTTASNLLLMYGRNKTSRAAKIQTTSTRLIESNRSAQLTIQAPLSTCVAKRFSLVTAPHSLYS